MTTNLTSTSPHKICKLVLGSCSSHFIPITFLIQTHDFLSPTNYRPWLLCLQLACPQLLSFKTTLSLTMLFLTIFSSTLRYHYCEMFEMISWKSVQNPEIEVTRWNFPLGFQCDNMEKLSSYSMNCWNKFFMPFHKCTSQWQMGMGKKKWVQIMQQI